MIGTDGAILLPLIGPPTLHPASTFASRTVPTPDARNHYHEFLDAVLKGPGTTCSAGFDYAQLVTEAVLLGSVAEHFPNETLAYDGAADARDEPARRQQVAAALVKKEVPADAAQGLSCPA